MPGVVTVLAIWDYYYYDGSDQNYDLHLIRLQYDYDKKLTRSFFARIKSCRMEAGTRDML